MHIQFKRFIFMLCLIVMSTNIAKGQKVYENNLGFSPVLAVKTNLLYWATTTTNLAVEVGLGKRTTFEVLGTYNGWNFDDNKKLKNWLIQPELRLWTCDRFNGHFFGLHAHYAEYNVGGIKWLGLDKYRYEGNLYGAGLSYGYQWIIGNRWNLEATVGVGYARLSYDQYECQKCGQFIKKDEKNYFGPTKVGLSFIFFIK